MLPFFSSATRGLVTSHRLNRNIGIIGALKWRLKEQKQDSLCNIFIVGSDSSEQNDYDAQANVENI
jgi:hypothetical protein